jgi:hypothetical protein
MAGLSEGRNDTLFRYCLAAARRCDDFDALLNVARTRNAEFIPPMEADEVAKAVRSAWRYQEEGRNFSNSSLAPILHRDDADLLATTPDAFLLLGDLYFKALLAMNGQNNSQVAASVVFDLVNAPAVRS